ncbi:efflux RND transporter permease subunit [Asticcacaulis sp. EMRT-3]|uniref:efflux RND transporter permease subunit n=1 Tax=Asticcacaulis sp. EMRT-3 TaxID=3040349 RepID=UPI0024AF18E0|nr:efflux RND transporter permease subunit [Asticcacaulis sp. EMRT-3]MDI7774932.1 efflux RND transporter permease subunit [Asticcacaulis sp. EMRT-3]
MSSASGSQTPRPGSGGFQISSWSIRNPIPTVVFFLVMTIAGIMGFQSLRVNNWPDIDFPIVVVTVVRSGAAPEELQNQVTRIIEDSVSGLGGVRHIQSFVNEGVSTTMVTFQLDVDLEKATNDVRNAVASVRSNLPGDVQDPIVSRVDNAQGQPLLTYVIRADNMSPEDLSWYVDNDVAKKALAVKGVSSLTRNGGVDREIRVELDPAKLAALGATASDISSQLRNFNVNMPGGRFNAGTSEQTIRTLGGADSIAQLSDMRITLASGQTVRLGDLGTVTDTWSEPRTRARYNGNEVVGFSIERTRGTSEKGVAEGVRAAIAKLRAENPHVQIEEVASSVNEVNRSFDSSMEALVIGALLAVAVVFLFLRDWRATLVSAVAMPMSLLPTFYVMSVLNQSFNIVTLLALSLTIGILVDDAIVEIENIVRHMREGKKPYPAAIEAADEIGLAVVATTATLIAVFAPTGFMPGIVGQFFKSFAIASCVSVFFSLVVARTLTPLMGAYLLRNDVKHDHDKPFWMDGYQKLLHWCLSGHVKWRSALLFHGIVIGLVFGILAAARSALVPGIIAVVAVVVFGLLALLARQTYMKTRWATLELGLLLGLLFGMGGFFMMNGPVMTAAKAAAPHGKAAVKAAVAAASHAPNPMAVPGLVMAVIAVILIAGAIFLCTRFKTSYLNARWAVVIMGTCFFIGSIALVVTLPQDNIPASDNSMSVMSISLPPGSTLDETDAVVMKIGKQLRAMPEVVSTYASENMESATMTINLVPKDKRKDSQAQFEQAFSKKLRDYPGVRASFGSDQGGGGTGVAYIVASDNAPLLASTGAELQREMMGLSQLTNVRSADNLTRPEIEITPKPDQAALMGVSTATISSAARVATMGDIDQVLAKYNDGDRQIPIRVLLKANALDNVNNLANLMVPTKYGTSVPLTAVADISYGAGPIQINRIDRTRVTTISADLNGVPQGPADNAVKNLPIMQKIAAGQIPGVHTIINPNTEDFVEMVPNFIIAIATGIGLMYIVLVLLFGSFSHPFTIMMALPLCYGGAFIGLIACHLSLSMPAYIGLIMLTGIAAKNSILLVEYAMVSMKLGVTRTEALMDAARKRARPIVMTTVAMGAGMIPVAVGNDSFRQPMAVAVIGGLITSTLLSLLFIPVMYTIVDQVSNFFGKRISPAFHAQGKEEPTE